jgi:hypothetical protein
MLLSLLAGFRDLSIGTDIQVYVVPIFEEVRNQSFVEMIRIYSSSESSTPVGFGLLAWCIEKITGNIHCFLFVIAFIITSFVFLSLDKILPKQLCVGMAIFMLFFYPESLNIMKQSIAVAICLFSIYFCLNKKPFHFLVLVAIAVSFHVSAITTLIIYPLTRILLPVNIRLLSSKRSRKNLLYFLTIMIFVAGYAFGPILVTTAATFHRTINWSVSRLGTGSSSVTPLVMVFLLIASYIVVRWIPCDEEPFVAAVSNTRIDHITFSPNFYSLVFLYWSVIGWVGVEFQLIAPNVDRIFLYERIFTILYVASLAAWKKRAKSVQYLFIIAGIYVFVSQIVISGNQEVFPYSSQLLGISV